MHLLKIMLKVNGRCGVPQGGVISPLLSNIYLNEVDSRFRRSRPPIPSLKPPGVPISFRPWFQFEAARGSDFKPPRVIIRAGQV
jgi:retron-type reverse transcriptase